MSSRLIELISASVTYRSGPLWARRNVEAIRNVSLSVDPGEIVGMVGESGSGKTTVGKLCLGVLQPTSGTAIFDGHYPIDRSCRHGQMAVVLQHPEWALNPRLKVAISIAEPLSIQGGVSNQEIVRRIEEALTMVGLDAGFADRYPYELSGGQRQRMAIARALITRPRFVVFDEAVSALDVSMQTQVLNLIKQLQTEGGFASLFISHDLAATRYVADRIIVMRYGEIVEEAPVHRFYERPSHPYSQALFDTIT